MPHTMSQAMVTKKPRHTSRSARRLSVTMLWTPKGA